MTYLLRMTCAERHSDQMWQSHGQKSRSAVVSFGRFAGLQDDFVPSIPPGMLVESGGCEGEAARQRLPDNSSSQSRSTIRSVPRASWYR
jgi:hypothetical protein